MRQKYKTYRFIVQYVVKKITFNLRKRFPSLSSWYKEHFPATRLQPHMDVWEYSVNFSSELVVALFVVAIAGANLLMFNPFKADYAHNDESLAAHVLRNHTGLNTQLAIKQNTVTTTVAENGFISQAFADDQNQVLGMSTYYDSDAEQIDDAIDDNGITKANPDSIQKLVSRQVNIYETKPFDTVYTVASQFGLTPRTIRETNNLPDNSLKAGWFLVIPPVDGIVIQVSNPNLTLTDVSHAYNADINKLVSYNGLEDAEDMVPVGDYLIVPHGQLPAPKVESKPKKTKPSIPRSVTIAGNHKFAPGHCTDYVARKVPGIKWGGNANRWMANAQAYGVTVDRNPVAGAILVTNENRRYGHVAYIEKVSGSTVYFSEWNYEGLYKTTYRSLDINDSKVKGVIHPNY